MLLNLFNRGSGFNSFRSQIFQIWKCNDLYYKKSAPGHEYKLDPQPVFEHVPRDDGGLQTYKAAGKLAGKKALITGGE